MRVLVWRRYGNTDVYSIETKEQFIKVLSEALEVLESWNLPDHDKWRTVVNTEGVGLINLNRVFYAISEEVFNDRQESFEEFSIVIVKE
jgi:SAM-dependent MidA family methyltransferase